MGGGEGLLVSYVAVANMGVDEPMVVAFKALLHFTIKEGQGFTQNRTTIRCILKGGNTSKAIGAGGSA